MSTPRTIPGGMLVLGIDGGGRLVVRVGLARSVVMLVVSFAMLVAAAWWVSQAGRWRTQSVLVIAAEAAIAVMLCMMLFTVARVRRMARLGPVLVVDTAHAAVSRTGATPDRPLKQLVAVSFHSVTTKSGDGGDTTYETVSLVSLCWKHSAREEEETILRINSPAAALVQGDRRVIARLCDTLGVEFRQSDERRNV